VRPLAGQRQGERGQNVVELALILPALMMFLLAATEFGFVFSHNLNLEYATREGARMGAALANGVKTATGTTLYACADVDPLIISSVERVLEAPGHQVNISQITQIRIYKSTATGTEAGPVNVWLPGAYTYSSATAGTLTLSFKPPATPGWDACTRSNLTPNPDELGVSLSYQYRMVTPLGAIAGMGPVGSNAFLMQDYTVMALNPTQ
jgi:hypothetical protein